MAFQAVARPYICIYGVWEARRKESFHTITNFTFSHVLSGTPNNKCKFLSKFAVKFVRISEKDAFSNCLQIMLCGHIFDNIL